MSEDAPESEDDAPEAVAVRPVASIELEGLKPVKPLGAPPKAGWIDPAELLIEEAYQRRLIPSSFALITKIVNTWDWRKFKPPFVARTPLGMVVIDGQHEAIAAFMHPDIDRIPIWQTEVPDLAVRASAFLGHNKDRIAVTPLQLYHASLVAGDEDALTIKQVCERANVKILESTPYNKSYTAGDCVAVGVIATLIARYGVVRARETLQVIRAADAAPISAKQIKAVAHLLFSKEFTISPDDITVTIQRMGLNADREAKIFAATHKAPAWRALAAVLYKNRRRHRRRRSPDEGGEGGDNSDETVPDEGTEPPTIQ